MCEMLDGKIESCLIAEVLDLLSIEYEDEKVFFEILKSCVGIKSIFEQDYLFEAAIEREYEKQFIWMLWKYRYSYTKEQLVELSLRYKEKNGMKEICNYSVRDEKELLYLICLEEDANLLLNQYFSEDEYKYVIENIDYRWRIRNIDNV